MTDLTPLDYARHGQLGVNEYCSTAFASTQHVMNLRAIEVGKAACSFPVFFTKSATDGRWAISAVTSLMPGGNLFVKDNQWLTTFQPTSMQTHPLYLVSSPDSPKGYALGIDESSGDFSTDAEEKLFDENGKPSMYASRILALLEADIGNDLATRDFAARIEALGLMKSVDVGVQFEIAEPQTITGLRTVDEEKLQSLSTADLEELNRSGYLVLMHAMLISIYQLNVLIDRNNRREDLETVSQIRLEIARDRSAGYA